MKSIPHEPPLSYRDAETKPRLLQTEIRAIVVLLVGIIDVPISSFPERSGHFIKQLTLRSGAQRQLSQTLLLGSRLLPQFLLITSLPEANTRKILKRVAVDTGTQPY